MTLSGRSHRSLGQAVLDQLETTHQGTMLARSMAAGEMQPSQAHHRMQILEHEGDARRGDLVRLLTASLSTPLDREDLFRLSRSVDDVLDTVRDFVREADIHAVSSLNRMLPLLDALVGGVALLTRAVQSIVEEPHEVVGRALAAKKLSGSIGRAYQYEVALLLSRPVTADTMKRRELIRRLDLAGARLSDATDTLADAALKRWA